MRFFKYDRSSSENKKTVVSTNERNGEMTPGSRLGVTPSPRFTAMKEKEPSPSQASQQPTESMDTIHIEEGIETIHPGPGSESNPFKVTIGVVEMGIYTD